MGEIKVCLRQAIFNHYSSIPIFQSSNYNQRR